MPQAERLCIAVIWVGGPRSQLRFTNSLAPKMKLSRHLFRYTKRPMLSIFYILLPSIWYRIFSHLRDTTLQHSVTGTVDRHASLLVPTLSQETISIVPSGVSIR